MVIHTNESGQAWYETEKGALPASPEVVDEALKRRAPLVAAELERTSARKYESAAPKNPTSARKYAGETSTLRKPVPNGVARAVHARAGNRCERCGDRGPLRMHHRKPVSEGGDNSRENLELLCGACHDRVHEEDYQTRPDWRRARGECVKRSP